MSDNVIDYWSEKFSCDEESAQCFFFLVTVVALVVAIISWGVFVDAIYVGKAWPASLFVGIVSTITGAIPYGAYAITKRRQRVPLTRKERKKIARAKYLEEMEIDVGIEP